MGITDAEIVLWGSDCINQRHGGCHRPSALRNSSRGTPFRAARNGEASWAWETARIDLLRLDLSRIRAKNLRKAFPKQGQRRRDTTPLQC